jgi:hypothetical protein
LSILFIAFLSFLFTAQPIKQNVLILFYPAAHQTTAEDESFNKMMVFHQELSETCQDLLARFAINFCLA